MIRPILRWAHAHRIAVLATAALLAIASALSLPRLQFDANVLHLLPRGGVAVPAFRDYLERFGSLDYLYVIVDAPSDAEIGDSDETVEWLATALRQAPEIAQVDAGPRDRGRDWSYLSNRVLLLVAPGQPELLERFRPGPLAVQVASTRELLSLPSPEMAELVQADPLGLLLSLRERLAGAASGMKLDAASGAYLSRDGRSRLLLARPKRPPFDTDFGRALFGRLDGIEAALAKRQEDPALGRDTPQLRVRFAGGHAIALEMEGLMRGESIWNAIGALVVILPLLYFAFRSPWLVAVGAIPSALSVLIVMGAYAWLGIPLSAAAAGAAAMQFGLGIDGVVLLFVAYRHVGRVVADDGSEDLSGPSLSMLLGMWTTAATFYGLAVVDFPSLEELGLLIGHSMMVCGLLTLVMVPALLPSRPPAVTALTTAWLPRLVIRRRGLILGAAAVITVAAAFAAPRLRIDPSLDRLRSTSPASGFEAEVASRFGLPRDVYLVVDEGPALEPLLEANERLVAALAREATGVAFHAPTSLLPSARTQDAAAALVAAQGIVPARVQDGLTTAAAAAGFRPGTFDRFASTLPVLLDPRARLTYDGFMGHGLGDLLDRSIVRRDGTWTVVTYLYPGSPTAVDGVRRALAAAGGTARLSGLPAVNREMAERFTPEFVKGVSVGSLIVLVLLIAAFRRWDFTLLALVPTALALTWTAGVLAVSGVSLDLFSMFAVMTFVGIGVDYGIHLVHRCAHGQDEARTDAVAHLGPVILVAALTTVFGFGTLVTSSYPPLRLLGIVSTVAIVALGAASLFVLPALLLKPRQ
ncbi:MAG: MMPL family transporter [Vicinamibacteraceae bacterium]